MTMMTRKLALAAALALAVFPFAGPASRAQEMTDLERNALHAEIRDYLLANPEVLMEMLALLEERKAAETEAIDHALVTDNADAIFDDGVSFVGGNPDGSFTVVEFLDYQCSFCRKAHPELMELIESDGDIRWIVKELPILGPGSVLASRAAIAALISDGPDAYGRLNDVLMRVEGPVDDAALDGALTEAGLDPAAIRRAMEDPEVERRMRESRTLAERLQISGTPTFVFGDRMVRGYVPLDSMRDLVDEIRAAEG